MTLMNHPIRIWCSLLLVGIAAVYTALVARFPQATAEASIVVGCLAIILILIDLRARRKPAKPR